MDPTQGHYTFWHAIGYLYIILSTLYAALVDFVPGMVELTFPANSSNGDTVCIDIYIIDDILFEKKEHFFVNSRVHKERSRLSILSPTIVPVVICSEDGELGSVKRVFSIMLSVATPGIITQAAELKCVCV
jgi:hypothetical protein